MLAVDTFRGVLSDVEVQALLSKGIVLLFLGLIPFAKVASAQDPNAIDQVVVTGSGESLTSPDLFSVDRRFLETPGAVTAYSSDQYHLGRAAYLEDFLPYVSGVLIQSSQGAEDTKISIRGSNAQDDDILGLSVLLDGIPLNQGDGEACLQDLDLRSVKYAEVYRGADAQIEGARSFNPGNGRSVYGGVSYTW